MMLGLLVFCLFISACSIIAGWAPLFKPGLLSWSGISQLASGIILGTAFIIVIPEGYEQASESGYPNLAGAASIFGFLFMLVINRKYEDRKHHTDPESQVIYDADNDGTLKFEDSTPKENGVAPFEVVLSSPQTWFSEINTTTLGLSIHTAADGVALAAASLAESKSSLKMLVFLSILLHKTPAAFSLTTLLYKQKSENRYSISQIKRDILLFSLTGPVVAMLLALPLFLLGVQETPKLFTGMCLGLSGGTFMFVTAHILESMQLKKSTIIRDVLLIGAGTLVAFLASFIPE